MGPMGSGPIHLAISCPHQGYQCHWRLGSGLVRVRCGKQASGAAIRIQVQDSVGAWGLGAWYQLILSKTLEITWSWTVSRAPDIGGKLVPIAASTQSCPRRVPMPLSLLLLMDPKELEMPLLVAQDHKAAVDDSEAAAKGTHKGRGQVEAVLGFQDTSRGWGLWELLVKGPWVRCYSQRQ